MNYNFEAIKQYVLTLGGFEESDKLDLQIKMLINEALAYCYRKDVPECMELPLADAIVNELNKSNFATSTVGFDGNVTSYSEGDMSISLGGSENTTATGSIAKYGGKLEGFKQIIGVVPSKRCCNVQG